MTERSVDSEFLEEIMLGGDDRVWITLVKFPRH
jgi:hypothetical protein